MTQINLKYSFPAIFSILLLIVLGLFLREPKLEQLTAPEFDDEDILVGGTYANFERAIFTSDGTFFKPTGITTFHVLVVGGGGGGGGYSSAGGGGGGGAGGLFSSTTFSITDSSISITVGAGGSAASETGASGSNGTTSSIGTLIAVPGGGGGAGVFAGCQIGGSGGGASKNQGTGCSPTDSKYGYKGGNHTVNNILTGGAGGGGAGGAGGDVTGLYGEGAGGAGYETDISGSTVTYARGGSGDMWGNSSGATAPGYGGDGGCVNANPFANCLPTDGTDGIVIIAWELPSSNLITEPIIFE